MLADPSVELFYAHGMGPQTVGVRDARGCQNRHRLIEKGDKDRPSHPEPEQDNRADD